MSSSIVGSDYVGGKWVSTISLFGLSEQFNPEGHAFETAVFEGPFALHTERYFTLPDAKAGHARVVQSIEDGTFEANHKSWEDLKSE